MKSSHKVEKRNIFEALMFTFSSKINLVHLTFLTKPIIQSIFLKFTKFVDIAC